MKKGILFIILCFLGIIIIPGCAFKNLNPLAKKSSPPVAQTEAPVKDAEKGAETKPEKVDIDKLVVQMVNDTRAGYFQKAIVTGESAFEQGKTTEKFLDTLAVAYGYKNQLEGLTEEEAKNYIKVVRQLSGADPANRFKKIVLAGALIETGSVTEGNKIALDLYNSAGESKPREVLDLYGWGLFKAGKSAEAVAIFNILNQLGTDNLSQTYHVAVVIENIDKARSLAMYKRIVDWANNALTWEENRDNLASTALINKIKKDSQDAINRLQLKGRSAN